MGHLSTCKATVEINGLWEPKENRKSDLEIMERLIASGRFTGKELQQINYFRIYLQVFFMSDIVSVKGTEVEEWARKGKRKGEQKRGKEIRMGMADTSETCVLESMERCDRVSGAGQTNLAYTGRVE
jgi:hypothetical protein